MIVTKSGILEMEYTHMPSYLPISFLNLNYTRNMLIIQVFLFLILSSLTGHLHAVSDEWFELF